MPLPWMRLYHNFLMLLQAQCLLLTSTRPPKVTLTFEGIFMKPVKLCQESCSLYYSISMHFMFLFYMSGCLSIFHGTLSWGNSLPLSWLNKMGVWGLMSNSKGQSKEHSLSFSMILKSRLIFSSGKKNNLFNSMKATEHESIVLLICLFFFKLQ